MIQNHYINDIYHDLPKRPIQREQHKFEQKRQEYKEDPIYFLLRPNHTYNKWSTIHWPI